RSASQYAEQVAQVNLDLILQRVQPRVLRRARYRDRIQVKREHAVRSEADGADRKNAGAGADVDDLLAAPHDGIERTQAECRRRMRAGAECHAGIELDNPLAGTRLVVLPCRLDRQPLRYADRLEILLPGIRPVLFIDDRFRHHYIAGIDVVRTKLLSALQYGAFNGFNIGADKEISLNLGHALRNIVKRTLVPLSERGVPL